MRLPERFSGGVSQVAEAATEMDGDQKKFSNYAYPAMTKTQGSFRLQVEAGEFTDSEIIVMLGENGTGAVPSLYFSHARLGVSRATVAMPGQCANLRRPGASLLKPWRPPVNTQYGLHWYGFLWGPEP